MVEHFCAEFGDPSFIGFLRYRAENRQTDGQTPLKTLWNLVMRAGRQTNKPTRWSQHFAVIMLLLSLLKYFHCLVLFYIISFATIFDGE